MKNVGDLLMGLCGTSTGALKQKLWVFSVGVLLLLPVAAAQTGFISIDCGSTSNYTDERGIRWITDDGYVGTGTNVNVTVPQDQVDDRKQLSTARYFQSGRKRFCYIFPVTNNGSYLIRASFLYGDLTTPLPIGYSFDVAIDSSIVGRIEIGGGEMNNLVTKEFFVVSRSEEIAFCLLSFKGNPFISSLELRPLEPQVFTDYMLSNQYGVLTQRLDCGTRTTDPTISLRYPDDKFDRIWERPGSSYNISTINASVKLDSDGIYDVPPTAMLQTAWQENSFWFTADFPLNQKYYVCFYFAEIRSLNATDQTVMNIILDDEAWYSNLTIYAEGEVQAVYSTDGVSETSGLTFTVEADPTSTKPALLNGFELHEIHDANTSTTASFDRQVLDEVRHSLNLLGWTGDPCLPIPWDWLSCTSDNPAMVTQIKLSNQQLQGTIPPNIGALAALKDLWLDNNFITGSIPNLGGLTELQTLHLQNNSLTGAIPLTLADIPLLTELFLQDNDFNGTVPVALLNRSGLTLTVDDANSPGASPPSPAPGAKSGSKGMSIGPIIGAVAGGVVVVVLLVGALIYCLRKRKQTTSQKDPKKTSDQKGAQTVFPVDKDGSVQNTKAFPLAEVNRITNNFQKKIGEGGFGPVFFGKFDNGTEVAVKVNSERSSQGRTEFYTEVNLLSRIHHRNLVHLIGFCDESNKRILVYEYMKEGMLREHLYGRGQRHTMNWLTRLRIAIDAARGLEYLHYDCHPRIIHRDVKSNNILLDENLQAKMIDFGISKSHEEDTTSGFSTVVKGTTGYLDPEYFSTNKLTYKSDVYAFGVVLLEIVSGRAPINQKLADQRQWVLVEYARQMLSEGRLEMIVDASLGHNYNKEAMWKVAELAMRCVDPRSINRPNMREVLKELVEAAQYEDEIGLLTSSRMSTSEIGTGDTTQTFTQNSHSRFAPFIAQHGFSNHPSDQRLSSASGRGRVHENTATGPWTLPEPR